MWLAIVEFFKTINQLLQILVPFINDLRDYINAQNKRLAESVAEEQEIKRKTLETETAIETANINAFHAIIDEAWKIRYSQILLHIQNKEFDKVLLLINKVDNADLNKVLFDDTMSSEYRAMKIINKTKS